MSWADTAAVQALIQTIPALASTTFLTRTPDGVVQGFPYVVVHPTAGVDEQTRVSGPRISEQPAFTLHICGESTEQVQAVQELIKAKFVIGGFFVCPTVSGRANKNGWWHSPIPIQNDTDVQPPIRYAVTELGWVSDPA